MPAYTALGEHLADAKINYVADDIRCILLQPGYTPNQDTDKVLADIVAFEQSGTGYTTGGKALTGKSRNSNAATNTTKWDCDDVVWATSTIPPTRWAAFYNNTHADKPLISYQDIQHEGQNPSSTNATFTVFTPTGIIDSTQS